jgi:hypothetical protein
MSIDHDLSDEDIDIALTCGRHINYRMVAGTYDLTEFVGIRLARWIEEYKPNTMIHDSTVTDFHIKDLNSAAQAVAAFLGANMGKKLPRFAVYSAEVATVISDQVFIQLIPKDNNHILLVVNGSRESVMKVIARFRSPLHFKNRVHIAFTAADGRMITRQVPFQMTNSGMDEMYPFLKTSLKEYFDGYMKSNIPILLLLGEPGTGKTTFLRSLVSEYNLNAVLTYDNSTMKSDHFYSDFMMGDSADIMIIEDADVILKNRETFGNHIMTKLLNFSEGLVPIFNKKIVFTTNIEHARDIDPALVRPGRCYDIVKFRPLVGPEINRLETAIGYSPSTIAEKTTKTVAEIFNRKDNQKSTGSGFF